MPDDSYHTGQPLRLGAGTHLLLDDDIGRRGQSLYLRFEIRNIGLFAFTVDP